VIYFNILKDDDPALGYSPLLRGINGIISYIDQQGEIGLTKAGAINRMFVHWAAAEFDWPGYCEDDLFAVNKVLNEADFPPLVDLQKALVALRMCRHHKGKFVLTSAGRTFAKRRGQLFGIVAPFFLTQVDHTHHGRTTDYSVGNWDVWLNVINVEAMSGATGLQLRTALYGNRLPGARYDTILSDLYIQVLRPLCWAGLLTEKPDRDLRVADRTFQKTPLWAAALQLRTDSLIEHGLHQ
jgi:hypothetical protein